MIEVGLQGGQGHLDAHAGVRGAAGLVTDPDPMTIGQRARAQEEEEEGE